MNISLVATIPRTSRISELVEGSDFSDCYQAPLNQCITPSDAYQSIFGHAPVWVVKLMSLRNLFAILFRLKHQTKSEMIEARRSIYKLPYIVGKRAGLFFVKAIELQELILGDDDRHLNFRISIFIHEVDERRVVSVSTVVIINNWLGHFYMFFVKPFHRLIARNLITAAISAGRL